jgi:hypothetical protein
MQTRERTVEEIDLSELGNVPASYVHTRRWAEPCESLIVPGAVLKWYEVRPHGWEIPGQIDDQARATVAAEAPAALAEGYGLGFVVHHQSTTGYYLLLMTWRGHQEMWRTIFMRPSDEIGEFEPLPPTRHAGTGCVWELGPICHEREAWSQYLFSARDDAAKRAYLANTFSGEV